MNSTYSEFRLRISRILSISIKLPADKGNSKINIIVLAMVVSPLTIAIAFAMLS